MKWTKEEEDRLMQIVESGWDWHFPGYEWVRNVLAYDFPNNRSVSAVKQKCYYLENKKKEFDRTKKFLIETYVGFGEDYDTVHGWFSPNLGYNLVDALKTVYSFIDTPFQVSRMEYLIERILDEDLSKYPMSLTKTILVVTKPYRDNKAIKKHRKLLLQRYEKNYK